MSPPESLSLEQRFVFFERDIQAHAKTLTAHNENLAAINIERAADKVRDSSLEERLDRIDASIEAMRLESNTRFGGIYKLGWWILATFGAAFIALFANFIFKGGMVL